MVSYYNPATAVAMFGRSGSGYHHHHHHSPPTQNHPYFTPGAYGAGHHHYNPHSHHASHQAAAAAAAASGTGGAGSPVGAGLGVGSGGLHSGVTSTQFSPTMATDFNCNHQYNPHFGNMTPDSMAVAAAAAAAASSPWATQTSMYSSACAAAAARNAAAVAAGLSSVAPPPPPPPPAPHGSSYDDWGSSVSGHPHHPHHMHSHSYQHHSHHPHASFYNHHASAQQPSPPSSTPSSPSSSHSPSHHVYSASSTTPNNPSNNNNNNNSSTPFKTEFGPCSGGNNQDASSSQEIQQSNQGNTASVAVVSSAGPNIGTPHSPDSGMAISDGVSSSGSPATNNGQPFHPTQHCLGGPSSNSSGSSSTNHSSNPNTGVNNGASNGNNGNESSQQQYASSGGNMVHGMGSHHNLHGHNHLHNMNSNHQNSGNLSHQHHHQSLVSGHPNGLVNVTSSGRPTQARSPYEWMKKPAYSCSSSGSNPSSNSAKTRTKDKYRVVYSDTQRLELEKEFHYSRYITIRRKAELASILGLSERQVKIWFQNRRAKERKVQRKREEMLQREKLATMVHMQNAAVAAAGGMGGPMCNQGNNGGMPLSALM